MKVALVGVPKSGKSKLARQMKDEDGFHVVDNIPQRFQKQTDRMIGFSADYRVDLALMGLRFTEYYKAMEKHEKFVMTTTYIDSYAYAGFGFQEMEYPTLMESEELSPDDLLDIGKFPYFFSTVVSSKVLLDSWLFDRVVYFPYLGEDEELKSLDGYYSTFLESYDIEHEVFSTNG